ncbi:hypothetical protein WA026_023495 [Henosepilachna vigintioctopunctata]|uniref:Uncharacterized protein n=1 Tax=Henosepilachna vigintioctopunctata TaxID=420089 RepID=A0AAW1V625_9CUCU
MDTKIQKKWLKAMKKLDPFGNKSIVYCCEDHFDPLERAIGRLRGFGFMLLQACVDLKQVDGFDSVVISACGIVNLQSKLFNLD